jgi:DNA-directed RNA polymerase subunit RPC12/RpoP
MGSRSSARDTGKPVRCRRCGSVLASAVTERTVVTTKGMNVPFRRETDYVSCPECMALYRVVDLRDGRAVPVTDVGLTSSL